MEEIKNCANSQNPSSIVDFDAEKRAREAKSDQSAQEPVFTLMPHICRHCFGRLASRLNDGLQEYRCTNCETVTVALSHEEACCCGMKIRKRNGAGRSGGPMVDAGIRCIPNPEKSPAFPSAYVACEVVKIKRP
jgi:hypothetical protein